ncbi:formyl transferase [Scleroderma yunnanense]
MPSSPSHLCRRHLPTTNFTRYRLHSTKTQAIPSLHWSASTCTTTRRPRIGGWTRSLQTIKQNTNLGSNDSTFVGPDSSKRGLETRVREPFTILFCGRDAFSCMVFKHLYEARDVWQGLHIATNPDVRSGRNGSRLDISPLKTLGETLEVPVHTIPKEKTAFRHWLPPPPFAPSNSISTHDIAHRDSSHVLVTASFGRILPSPFLRLFPETQCLNVHPSLLPAYRGPAPIQRALMAAETETGVCVIQMGEVRRKVGKLVDQGGVWAIEKMGILGDAAFTDIQTKLAESGGKLLVEVLRDMLSGKARRTPQAPLTTETPYAPAITAMDSTIVFSAHTAKSLVRLERAIGHQRALTLPSALPDGRSVSLAGLRAVTPTLGLQMSDMCPGTAKYLPHADALLVTCAGGEVLSVDRLQTQDRAMLRAKDWWNGVKGMGLVKDGIFSFNTAGQQ